MGGVGVPGGAALLGDAAPRPRRKRSPRLRFRWGGGGQAALLGARCRASSEEQSPELWKAVRLDGVQSRTPVGSWTPGGWGAGMPAVWPLPPPTGARPRGMESDSRIMAWAGLGVSRHSLCEGVCCGVRVAVGRLGGEWWGCGGGVKGSGVVGVWVVGAFGVSGWLVGPPGLEGIVGAGLAG